MFSLTCFTLSLNLFFHILLSMISHWDFILICFLWVMRITWMRNIQGKSAFTFSAPILVQPRAFTICWMSTSLRLCAQHTARERGNLSQWVLSLTLTPNKLYKLMIHTREVDENEFPHNQTTGYVHATSSCSPVHAQTIMIVEFILVSPWFIMHLISSVFRRVKKFLTAFYSSLWNLSSTSSFRLSV